ncbi:MAG: PleD family two-component system response regulator [Pseudanabaenaceae cyanobacterium]
MSARKKVLVVDDSKVVRKQVRSFLENDLEVLEAGNAQEAIAIAKEGKPDMIILDYLIPAGQGIRVIRAIQDDWELKYTPIVVMSGSSEQVFKTIPEPLEEKGLVFLHKSQLNQPENLLAAMRKAREVIKRKEIEDSRGAPKPNHDELVVKVLQLEDKIAHQQRQIQFLLSQIEQQNFNAQQKKYEQEIEKLKQVVIRQQQQINFLLSHFKPHSPS